MQLSRLVYYSTNALKSRGAALASDLKLLLTSSIVRNSERGVTGGLVFNSRYFMQVLEGPDESVTRTYSRIAVDRRHREVNLVELKPIDARAFGTWAMGYAGRPEYFDALRAQSARLDPSHMSGDTLAAFIHELVAREEGVGSSARIAFV